ncbi:ABC transporter substrate-binding protein [Mycoplasmopsis fermentans]|uniref:ABC transporter substrate-binding protein n=1 Tax=Mycoplasmopsis fermentans TaxID=2115 RepID=UPI000F019070|nr:ABC transporter substrate-binding protein [Mycoplasmopsis fermentans]RMX36109.1 bacterial extracellular solute-binding s, 5 Middle family protein [Mycoplasmopsis fermentans MF-I1]
MKRNKLILSLASLSTISTASIVAVSCGNKAYKTNYDLGLVTEPINSLNYLKFNSVSKVLPSIVESPLKTGPNEALKRILSLPEIPMGVYGNDDKSNSMDDYIANNRAPKEASGRFYPLDQFGSAPGTINTDRSEYQPVSVVMTKNNKILSLHITLNRGESRWSNNDIVTADDYIDAMHYILDINTGSQKQTNILQRKFRSSSSLIDAQQEYIKKHKKAYSNPFAYPKLIKENGQWIYDVLNPNYKPWACQLENEADKAEVEKIKEEALKLGLYSGRMYWNYDNQTILAAIPYSPDFNENDEITTVMLPNPEYSLSRHTAEELKLIPQRIATKIRKYLYFDPRQSYSETKFKPLVKKAKKLKSRMNKNVSFEKDINEYNQEVNKLYGKENTLNNNSIDSREFMENRVLALDEFSLRVEYDSNEPTSLSNAYSDIQSTLIPVNRKFVESIGGIREFGLDKSKFLTNGPFYIKNIVLGPQGYMELVKNNTYYSSTKTISDSIKIYFSSDANINSAMYDDGYIAATKIPAVQQINYWTNKSYRPFMKKSSGFGTIALAFNLDQETNKNSLINDVDLRNALYFGINRNEMLNIVGWNSSFPVITWTAFGQGSSSFGDAVEIGFDHDFMKTKVSDKKIPIQNYNHVDHLAKQYNNEHVDRTDLGYNLEIARAYMQRFKDKHPDVKQVTLKYISNSTDEQQNAGIALKDFIKKAFGDYLIIDVQGLPENVYEDFRTTGKYDLIYRNFDTFGSDSYSYVKVFFKPDEIDRKNQKTTGFRNNPSGSWTYQNYFESLGYVWDDKTQKLISNNAALVDETIKRLNMETKQWNKILDLAFRKTYVDQKDAKHETITKFTERYLRFFSNQFNEKEKAEGWTEQSAFGIITALEKIIRDAAPVVPLMEVDTYWEISRVNGTESLFTYSLQFAYDVAKPPRATLPTVIKS